MNALYSEKDVSRWEKTNSRAFEILGRRLGNEPLTSTDSQGLSLLSLAHIGAGFTGVASGDAERARHHFQQSVRIKLRIFDLYEEGTTGADACIRTGEFQTLLTAHAAGAPDLATQFAKTYRVNGFAVERSPADSTYIGKPMKALSLGDVAQADECLSRPAPNVDPQFAGYVECLQAIAKKDENAFVAAIQGAASQWESFIYANFRGHPQAACFLGGVGFIHLVRQVVEAPFDVQVKHVPRFLLG